MLIKAARERPCVPRTIGLLALIKAMTRGTHSS